MIKKFPLLLVSWCAVLSLLLVTSWASWHESVLVGGGKLLREPWGIATLFDTYFAFLFFYLWVFARERSWVARLGWFLGIMLLGNMAMGTYILLALRGKKSEFAAAHFLTEKKL